LTGTARPQVILAFDCDTIVPEATIAIDLWELPAITAIPIPPSLPSSASSSLMEELRAKARAGRRATKEYIPRLWSQKQQQQPRRLHQPCFLLAIIYSQKNWPKENT
jgi:hypothetical protein